MFACIPIGVENTPTVLQLAMVPIFTLSLAFLVTVLQRATPRTRVGRKGAKETTDDHPSAAALPTAF